jgi:hypothetical protein
VLELAKNKSNERTIKVLEDALERAKSGDIQNIVIYGSDGNRNTFNQFNVDTDFMVILGESRLVERDLIDLHADLRKEVSWDFCNV